jgi:hypothetical protein
MKVAVFRVVVPCNLNNMLADFIIALIMVETTSTSEMLVSFYQITWCYNPVDSCIELQAHLQTVQQNTRVSFIQTE